MRLLFIGDIVGNPGRHMVEQHLPRLIDEYAVDFTIANGENSSHGFGMSRRSFQELHACGVDCFTMGNHTWDHKELAGFIDHEPRIVRPANYPPGLPGRGEQSYTICGRRLRVINLIGRVYLPAQDCPFRKLNELLAQQTADWTFVDFHAEATSEKVAMGWYADGRVSALAGTHTHVQTADARVLPRGTGYITDAGMTGPRDSVLGVERETILTRFLTGISPRFEPAHGDLQFNGVLFDLAENGGCTAVTPLQFWQPAL